MTKTIHLYKNNLDRNLNIFLLLVPAIVFVLVLTFLVSSYKKGVQSKNQTQTVLGEESQNLNQ